MKERLDVILVRQGFAPSREKAKAILMTGNVFVDGQREDKAGTTFDESKGQYIKVCKPRRSETGESDDGVSD